MAHTLVIKLPSFLKRNDFILYIQYVYTAISQELTCKVLGFFLEFEGATFIQMDCCWARC